VNGVKRFDEPRLKGKGVRLDKPKRVVRLWPDVDPNNVESRPGITDASTTSTTKKIEQSRLSSWRFDDTVAVK
jgi:hypothetical protein